MPRYTVTWPTRPAGVYTVIVRASDPTEAARVAAAEDLPTTEGYSLAYDYEPEIWHVRHPYAWRSRHVQGPDYNSNDAGANAAAFVPVPAI